MTTPSTEWPLFIEYVSKIHAITRPSVPTSGAGMSTSGPIWLMISLVKRRVIRCSSLLGHLLRVADDAALRAAERNARSAHFHVIHIASDLTSSSVTSGW